VLRPQHGDGKQGYCDSPFEERRHWQLHSQSADQRTFLGHPANPSHDPESKAAPFREARMASRDSIADPRGTTVAPGARMTNDVRAHGDPAMPVWGETFRAESAWDMGRRVEVQGKLMLITDYVRSIQAK
jgi:hypothetical protein